MMEPFVLVIGLYGQSFLFHIENFPVEGETVFGDLISVEPGGKGYNQAVSVARNNIPIRFVTAVGDDDFGKNVYKECESEGIDGKYCIILPDQYSACASVMSDQSGSSRVIVSKGACGHFHSELLDHEMFVGCKVLLLQLEMPMDLAISAAREAKKNNALVILDPAPAQTIPQDLIDLVDIVTPNIIEARKLTVSADDCDEISLATKLHGMGFENVIITLGDRGVFVSLINIKAYSLPAIEIGAKDTTGAGDTFNGTLAAGLFHEQDLQKSIEYALVASGLCVSRNGVMDSIPNRHEIQQCFDALHRD